MGNNGLKHMHKHLVNKESLTAGTGYDIKYTNMIKSSAMRLNKEILSES